MARRLAENAVKPFLDCPGGRISWAQFPHGAPVSLQRGGFAASTVGASTKKEAGISAVSVSNSAVGLLLMYVVVLPGPPLWAIVDEAS